MGKCSVTWSVPLAFFLVNLGACATAEIGGPRGSINGNSDTEETNVNSDLDPDSVFNTENGNAL